jgi:hypothetical protein
MIAQKILVGLALVLTLGIGSAGIGTAVSSNAEKNGQPGQVATNALPPDTKPLPQLALVDRREPTQKAELAPPPALVEPIKLAAAKPAIEIKHPMPAVDETEQRWIEIRISSFTTSCPEPSWILRKSAFESKQASIVVVVPPATQNHTRVASGLALRDHLIGDEPAASPEVLPIAPPISERSIVSDKAKPAKVNPRTILLIHHQPSQTGNGQLRIYVITIAANEAFELMLPDRLN